jgi:hypothetical protein
MDANLKDRAENLEFWLGDHGLQPNANTVRDLLAALDAAERLAAGLLWQGFADTWPTDPDSLLKDCQDGYNETATTVDCREAVRIFLAAIALAATATPPEPRKEE